MTGKMHKIKIWVIATSLLLATSAPMALAQTDNSVQDMAHWSSIMNSNDPELFKDYLQKFPNGVFTLAAREKIKALSSGSIAEPARPDGSHLRKLAKQSYKHDLDGDGRMEEILLLPSGKNDLEEFYSLTVLDDKGGIVWAGPIELNSQNPLVFGEGEFGDSMPEVIGDFNGDGTVNLVAPAMQGDLSPTVFRVLRWENGAFEPVHASMLLEKPEGSGKFPWISGEQYDEVWIASFKSIDGPGEVTAVIADFRNQTDLKYRWALLRGNASGFTVTRWIEDPTNGDSEPEPDTASSIEQLLQQADQFMSEAHRESDATRRNKQAVEALNLYRKAAKKGSAKAYYNIGFLYEIGTGVKRNNNTAIEYYEKAASNGYMEAFPQIILVQNQFKNYKGAANTFFRYYKANPTLALAGIDNWSYSPAVLRAIQKTLKASGHYRGAIDGKIGPGSRAAIETYVQNHR